MGPNSSLGPKHREGDSWVQPLSPQKQGVSVLPWPQQILPQSDTPGAAQYLQGHPPAQSQGAGLQATFLLKPFPSQPHSGPSLFLPRWAYGERAGSLLCLPGLGSPLVEGLVGGVASGLG